MELFQGNLELKIDMVAAQTSQKVLLHLQIALVVFSFNPDARVAGSLPSCDNLLTFSLSAVRITIVALKHHVVLEL